MYRMLFCVHTMLVSSACIKWRNPVSPGGKITLETPAGAFFSIFISCDEQLDAHDLDERKV